MAEDDQLRAQLVRDYHQTKKLVESGADDEIDRLVKQNDLVFGVWLDKGQPREIGYKLLKGNESRMYNRGRVGLACRDPKHADVVKARFCASF